MSYWFRRDSGCVWVQMSSADYYAALKWMELCPGFVEGSSIMIMDNY